MATYNVHAAKTQLSRLIDRAAAGEEIVIARAGKPVVKLVPAEPEQPRKSFLGALSGSLIYMAPDFDETPEDLIALFEGDGDPGWTTEAPDKPKEPG